MPLFLVVCLDLLLLLLLTLLLTITLNLELNLNLNTQQASWRVLFWKDDGDDGLVHALSAYVSAYGYVYAVQYLAFVCSSFPRLWYH